MDILGIWVGAILTLLVFSYLLTDSPLFRLAQAIFVGVAIGYGFNVAIQLILVPTLITPLFFSADPSWALIVPFILGILLLLKLRTAWSSLGNISIAFLFGVGAALTLGGAVTGTLMPQVSATIVSLTPAQNVDTFIASFIIAFGTIAALLSFRFLRDQQHLAARSLELVGRAWGYTGKWFILIAFGAIFADTAISRISVLISRIYFLLHDWLGLVK
jgi:hypothetical protein